MLKTADTNLAIQNGPGKWGFCPSASPTQLTALETESLSLNVDLKTEAGGGGGEQQKEPF